jgi:hypothetical protein
LRIFETAVGEWIMEIGASVARSMSIAAIFMHPIEPQNFGKLLRRGRRALDVLIIPVDRAGEMASEIEAVASVSRERRRG